MNEGWRNLVKIPYGNTFAWIRDRRERWTHLKGAPFAIRRLVTLHPLIEGAAYATEMVERRVLPDRRQVTSRTK